MVSEMFLFITGSGFYVLELIWWCYYKKNGGQEFVSFCFFLSTNITRSQRTSLISSINNKNNMDNNMDNNNDNNEPSVAGNSGLSGECFFCFSSNCCLALNPPVMVFVMRSVTETSMHWTVCRCNCLIHRFWLGSLREMYSVPVKIFSLLLSPIIV